MIRDICVVDKESKRDICPIKDKAGVDVMYINVRPILDSLCAIYVEFINVLACEEPMCVVVTEDNELIELM